jgi:hypothetical protein
MMSSVEFPRSGSETGMIDRDVVAYYTGLFGTHAPWAGVALCWSVIQPVAGAVTVEEIAAGIADADSTLLGRDGSVRVCVQPP